MNMTVLIEIVYRHISRGTTEKHWPQRILETMDTGRREDKKTYFRAKINKNCALKACAICFEMRLQYRACDSVSKDKELYFVPYED